MYALGCPLFQCAGLRLRIDIEIVLRGFQLAGLILLRVDFPNSHDSKEKIMLHLIWYIIVGFLAGCVAKALMHTHLSITWTVVLGIERRRPISSRRFNRFHPRGDFSPLSLAQVPPASTARLDLTKRRRLHSRHSAGRLRSRHALQGTQLT